MEVYKILEQNDLWFWVGGAVKLLICTCLFSVQVRRSEALLTKIQSYSIEIGHILCRVLQSSPSTSSLSGVQVCTKLETVSCILWFLCNKAAPSD